MLFAHTGAIAALVGLSQSLLIPPEVSASDKDLVTALPFEDAVIIDTRVMEVSCVSCTVVPGLEMHLQPQSILKLNFTVAHNDVDQLLLNGLPIYPPGPESFLQPLTAPLISVKDETSWAQVATPQLGYSFSVSHPSDPHDGALDLVAIHVEILEVGGTFLSGIPTVEIRLLETTSGKLMLADAQISQPKSDVAKPTDDGRECTTIICKWRAIFADRISKLKGCGAKARPHGFSGHKKPHHKGHHGGHGGRPGPHRPRPFRHHHRHGGASRFLKSIVLHVFIPVLIGIMVGISVSLVGMIAGHAIVFIWRNVFRRGQEQQYIEIKQREDKEDIPEDVRSFLVHGPPPEYEEAEVEKTEQ